MGEFKSVVEGGKVLDGVYIIGGPAALELLSGEAHVLGHTLDRGEQLTIPVGRRVPVLFKEAKVRATGSLEQGSVDAYKRMEEAARALAGLSGRIVLIGPPDSGKSTLAAWAVNLSGGETSLLSVDVGQNEYYAPAFETILTKTALPLIPGAHRGYGLSCFVGAFTPSRALARYVACASRLASISSGALVVDTDGWVLGYQAVHSKVMLAEALNADYIVSLGVERRIGESIARSVGARHVHLGGPLVPSTKTREERRVHRERLIAARLLEGRVIPVRADEVPIINSPVFNCTPIAERVPGAVYAERCGGGELVIVARGPRRRPVASKGSLIVPDGWERNRIAAVVDDESNHHLALVLKANYKNRSLTIKTVYQGRVRALLIGEASIEITLGD